MCYTKDLILTEFTKNTAPENFTVLSLSFYYERNSGVRDFSCTRSHFRYVIRHRSQFWLKKIICKLIPVELV